MVVKNTDSLYGDKGNFKSIKVITQKFYERDNI